jgi:hypothetical protein
MSSQKVDISDSSKGVSVYVCEICIFVQEKDAKGKVRFVFWGV